MASFAPLVHHLCPRCASGERNLDGDVDGDLAESVSVAASMGAERARISKASPTLADSARISLSMDHMVQTSAQWDTLIETSFRMLAAAQVHCAWTTMYPHFSLTLFSTKHVVKTLHRYCTGHMVWGGAHAAPLSSGVCSAIQVSFPIGTSQSVVAAVAPTRRMRVRRAVVGRRTRTSFLLSSRMDAQGARPKALTRRRDSARRQRAARGAWRSTYCSRTT